MESTLERGIQKAKDILKRSKNKPLLAAVYGLSDSGKSHIIDLIAEDFMAYRGSGAPPKSLFMSIKAFAHMELYLFHCGWQKQEEISEDPVLFSRNILGRELDLTIGIYNPRFYARIDGEYDIVISNPGSVRKSFKYNKI